MLGVAVHATNAASRKNLDPGHGRNNHRGCHRGGTHLTCGNDEGNVSAADLDRVTSPLAKELNILHGQARFQAAVHDGDGGGHGAMGAHFGFHLQGSCYVLRVGHAMRNDGGFQGDDRFVVAQSLLHLGGNV